MTLKNIAKGKESDGTHGVGTYILATQKSDLDKHFIATKKYAEILVNLINAQLNNFRIEIKNKKWSLALYEVADMSLIHGTVILDIDVDAILQNSNRLHYWIIFSNREGFFIFLGKYAGLKI